MGHFLDGGPECRGRSDGRAPGRAAARGPADRARRAARGAVSGGSGGDRAAVRRGVRLGRALRRRRARRDRRRLASPGPPRPSGQRRTRLRAGHHRDGPGAEDAPAGAQGRLRAPPRSSCRRSCARSVSRRASPRPCCAAATCGARWWPAAADEETLPPGSEDRLSGLAELVGQALDNDDRRAALAASRTRLVQAGDEARRRLERALHEGAHQHVVALALKLRVALGRAEPDSEIADVLRELLADAMETSAELSDLARGLHPAVLTERGLAAALQALTARCARPGQHGRASRPPLRRLRRDDRVPDGQRGAQQRRRALARDRVHAGGRRPRRPARPRDPRQRHRRRHAARRRRARVPGRPRGRDRRLLHARLACAATARPCASRSPSSADYPARRCGSPSRRARPRPCARPHREARTYCGKVTMRYSYGSYDFKTYRIEGRITCKSVRRVLRQSIPLNKQARGWECIKRGAPRPVRRRVRRPEGRRGLLPPRRCDPGRVSDWRYSFRDRIRSLDGPNASPERAWRQRASRTRCARALRTRSVRFAAGFTDPRRLRRLARDASSRSELRERCRGRDARLRLRGAGAAADDAGSAERRSPRMSYPRVPESPAESSSVRREQ